MMQHLDYAGSVAEDTVVNYLRRHPEFFLHHPTLLAQLKVPHQSGTAVSLVERQVRVLRDENQNLQRKLAHLVDAAKRNEHLSQRIQRIVTRLAGIHDTAAFFAALYQVLQEEYLTDAITLRLFEVPHHSECPEFCEYDAEVFQLFETVLKSNQPLCGRLSIEQHGYLFPLQKISSAVLLPLGDPKPYGLLALGSADVARYHASMATDLLKHLAQLISQLLKPCLKA